MNQINVIKPYLWNNTWVFDDPAVGLVKEPFVSGVPALIEAATLCYDIPNPKDGFVVIFSKDPFPDFKICLEWVRQEFNGNVYRWPAVNLEGWLCPALLKYFDTAPDKLYIDLKPL